MEVLRWKERYRKLLLRKWRLCRFCRLTVEDKVHALLSCTGHIELAHRQNRFFADPSAIVTTFHEFRTSSCTGLDQLWFLIRVSELPVRRLLLLLLLQGRLSLITSVLCYASPRRIVRFLLSRTVHRGISSSNQVGSQHCNPCSA
ncbi:hypothetical protein DFS33DRAFT_830435 [Desarmillaria ectypa]|nr:hypothetical protein DFS33DRAFT_830435 [Desarmillaria ectypa]